MTFIDELISASSEIWQECYDHPFIQQMIDGTLDKENFCLYLLQDTLYLVDYAKVYAHAMIKAEDMDIIRWLYNDMGLVHSTEDMMHIQYLKEFGYSENDAYKYGMLGGCRDYVNYMLRVASDGSCADGVMAVLPCALSYYYIGLYCLKEAKARGTYENNPFKAWIDEYSGEGYKAVFDRSVELGNLISKDSTDKEKAKFKEIFLQGSRYELGFWEMGITNKAPIRA